MRFKVVAAGRRSGKTELAKRKLVVTLAEKKAWEDPRYFAAAPTREQAKRIFWADLKRLVPPRWVRRVFEAELCIVTKFGAELRVVGLDKPQRIEGAAWDGGVLDEFGDMRGDAWPEHVRPALSDRAGWCWFIGVPEGFNHFRDLAEYARSGKDPDWAFYTWRSAEILPPDEVEAAKRLLDARTFRQEYEASFEGAAGRAYHAYASARHEDPAIEIDQASPLILCCDFNVAVSVWPVAQEQGGRVAVVDEIAMENTNTVEMAREFMRRHGGHKGGVTVYGDSTGGSRSTAGRSDYALLAEAGLKRQRVKRANPPVRDRVNAVNAMFENARGEVRLAHHPRCARLRRDLETVEWDGSGSALDKRDPTLTHGSDALGYFIEYEYPITAPPSSTGARFYK